ncbi:MAG TPA: DUF4190 domain-containing protein [Armatimonadota bacterium]|jgi:prepilin-type processing-associated H-X9-DG protein
MECPKCGADNKEGAITCGLCGETLAAAPPTSIAPPPATSTLAPPPQAYLATALPKANGLATTALVLGIVSLCGGCLFAIAGLIVGIIARNQIKASGGQQTGDGLATAGIVTSSIGLLFIPIIASIMFPVFAKAREKARQATCMSNQQSITMALQMYLQDHGDKFPASDKWVDATLDYTGSKKIYVCPSAASVEGKSTVTYGYNNMIAGTKGKRVVNTVDFTLHPSPLIVIADSPGPLIFSEADIVKDRHSKGFIVGYADGRVRWFPTDATVKLQP